MKLTFIYECIRNTKSYENICKKNENKKVSPRNCQIMEYSENRYIMSYDIILK